MLFRGLLQAHNFSSLTARAVSPNGEFVVGVLALPTGRTRPFRCRESTGEFLPLDLPPGADSGSANAVSDGGIVVGSVTSGFRMQAYRWTETGGTVLDVPGTQRGNAKGISGDGSTIVGDCSVTSTSTTRFFRWAEPAGAEILGDGQAAGVNHDGSVIVGSSGSNAFRWNRTEKIVLLEKASNQHDCMAYGVSPDGLTTVGRAVAAQTPMLHLAASWKGPNWKNWIIQTAMFSEAYGTNGSISVGYVTIGLEHHATLWTAGSDRHLLKDLITGAGGNLYGWSLDEAKSVSADGKVIVGNGRYFSGAPGAPVVSDGWVARLPSLPH